jgi:hypothetical protein
VWPHKKSVCVHVCVECVCTSLSECLREYVCVCVSAERIGKAMFVLVLGDAVGFTDYTHRQPLSMSQ